MKQENLLQKQQCDNNNKKKRFKPLDQASEFGTAEKSCNAPRFRSLCWEINKELKDDKKMKKEQLK